MDVNQIITGDARELAQAIPDESVDLIFTDPPYLKEYLHLYSWLSEEAARVLKPGGFCLSYTGDALKYKTMCLLSSNLTYAYDFVLLSAPDPTTGRLPSYIYWPMKVCTRHKSILAFMKGKGKPRKTVMSVIQGSGIDKRFHKWGQDERSASYYVDCFSYPGNLVLDPFTGGGTTGAVCKVLGRNFIGFEIDPATADVARKRLTQVQMPLPGLEIEQLLLSGSEVTAAS